MRSTALVIQTKGHHPVKVIACSVLAVALGLSACERGPNISQDPAVIGQTVTLTGKIKEVHAPNVLELDTKRGDVLVVTPQPRPDIKEGERVSITGDVRHLTVAEFEQNYSLDVAAPMEARVASENFVAAREIKPA
jgi:hypothetical protein